MKPRIQLRGFFFLDDSLSPDPILFYRQIATPCLCKNGKIPAIRDFSFILETNDA